MSEAPGPIARTERVSIYMRGGNNARTASLENAGPSLLVRQRPSRLAVTWLETIDMSSPSAIPSDPACARPGFVVWLTGLPAAGKTTLATELAQRLRANARPVVRLDGDILRRGLSSDLGFSPADRAENIRRAAEVARLVADSGQICVAALISPLVADRAHARRIAGEGRFIEVYVSTPPDVCRQRDFKGNYARAERGEIADFTGVSAPYDPPPNPEVIVYPQRESVDQAIERILAHLAARENDARRT